MKYNHLSQNERYQIFSLMKEGLNCTQIANNLGRSKSTISSEIRRNKGGRGYRPKQADRLPQERSIGSRNARRIEPHVLKAAFERISEQLSPEQVAAELPISHEALYQHIYVNKPMMVFFGRIFGLKRRRESVMLVELTDAAKSPVDTLFTSVLQMLKPAGPLDTGRGTQSLEQDTSRPL